MEGGRLDAPRSYLLREDGAVSLSLEEYPDRDPARLNPVRWYERGGALVIQIMSIGYGGGTVTIADPSAEISAGTSSGTSDVGGRTDQVVTASRFSCDTLHWHPPRYGI